MQKLTDADLIREHNEKAQSTIVEISYYLDELRRRDQAASDRTIRNLTLVILGTYDRQHAVRRDRGVALSQRDARGNG